MIRIEFMVVKIPTNSLASVNFLGVYLRASALSNIYQLEIPRVPCSTGNEMKGYERLEGKQSLQLSVPNLNEEIDKIKAAAPFMIGFSTRRRKPRKQYAS
jgi:hypothetical protein